MRGIQARLGLGVVAGAITCVAFAGCVGVSAKHTQICCERHLVAVDGQVYMVNASNGKVMRIELVDAEPFSADDARCQEHDHHEHHDDDDDD